MTPNGAIIHHPTSSPEALRAWKNLHTLLGQERPGYILWALNDDLTPLFQHIQIQSEESVYRIVPFLIAPGKHFQEDITHVEEKLSAKRPDLRFERAPVLLEDQIFLNNWISRL